MQIIIDIPDEYYQVTLTKIMLACHGYKIIELPKGHGELIDRNEAEKIAHKMFEHITSPLLNHIQTYDAYSIIRLTPTVIEADNTEKEDFNADNN